jgi:hypothetical protein
MPTHTHTHTTSEGGQGRRTRDDDVVGRLYSRVGEVEEADGPEEAVVEATEDDVAAHAEHLGVHQLARPEGGLGLAREEVEELVGRQVPVGIARVGVGVAQFPPDVL